MDVIVKPRASVVINREVIGHAFLDLEVVACFEVSIGRHAEPNQTSACHGKVREHLDLTNYTLTFS